MSVSGDEGSGGGIENLGVSTGAATVNLTNSTVSGNSADIGGGIYSDGAAATINLNYSTVASNTATRNGGGLYQDTTVGGVTNLKNSIVADNDADTGPDISGTITSQDYNHVESTDGGTFVALANDVTGSDPQLGPLANNGGPTATHLPGGASPVLNTIAGGISECGTTVTVDQRGAFLVPAEPAVTKAPLKLVAPAGRPVPTSQLLPLSAPWATTSQPTGASTPWAGAALTQPATTSLTRSSTTRPPTPGSPRSLPIPDNKVNNMACGVLTVGGTPQIYCVGGSAAGGTTATARVFSYNPVTDTITTLTAADNWPGNTAGTILPGGFAVAGNKLYIIGGFNIGTGIDCADLAVRSDRRGGLALAPAPGLSRGAVLYPRGQHRRVDLHRRRLEHRRRHRDGHRRLLQV